MFVVFVFVVFVFVVFVLFVLFVGTRCGRRRGDALQRVPTTTTVIAPPLAFFKNNFQF